MERIQSFVIFDLETTGLPHREYNSTKITELCLIAATRKDIRTTEAGKLPPISKLSFLLNPEKLISEDAARLTGISNNLVKNSPTFKEIFRTFHSFIEELKKPVCLVAHNGNTFDYKILLAECVDANVLLPNDLLCVDSLIGFRTLYKVKNDKSTRDKPKINKNTSKNLNKVKTSEVKTDKPKVDKNASNSGSRENVCNRSMDDSLSDIMTDDEEEWPNMNVTPEELADIDELCASIQNLSTTPVGKDLNISKSDAKKANSDKRDMDEEVMCKIVKEKPKTVEKNKNLVENSKKRVSFTLTEIYTRYFGGMDGKNAHRAEDDCIMLLQCIVAAQSVEREEDFLKWSDKNCKFLSDIAPLIRKQK